jgi:glycosyltransferase involved in cell wall biosynthesis
MRLTLWHGWRLEGSGSSVFTARIAETLRAGGHDVLVLCQEPAASSMPFVDGVGTVSADGVSTIEPTGAGAAAGNVTVLLPSIGSLLPVFVVDEYEGFEVKRFVDLSDEELTGYLRRNADALRVAVEWHGSEAVVAGHAVPGPSVARLALGPGRYIAKVHGSDLEYAVRQQPRLRDLAREGLEGALAVTGASQSVLRRTVELFPSVATRVVMITPGVDPERFRPRARAEGLLAAAGRLDDDPRTGDGRPSALDAEVVSALEGRDAAAFEGLAARYDQDAPDPEAAARLRDLASGAEPVVGYFGKLIPQKGVEIFLQALASLREPAAHGLVIGFGTFREWLAGLTMALDRGDAGAFDWLRSVSPMQLELPTDAVRAAAGFASRVTFTGRLDHSVAPEALAALDVLVVPSTLSEAFGMVAAEGAAAGALPLVARHSGLAELAAALEELVERPGWFSYEPGPGAVERLTGGIERLLAVPETERKELARAVSDFVREEWTWERAARILLDTASRRPQ